MLRDLFRCSCLPVLALALGACSLTSIPIEAPKEPIRIEATVVIKHEYVLVQSDVVPN
jgi:hypothetical protein